ncbi:MAG: YraN family protein [Tatlockia sp.]|jgi:putative endonuclease
MSLKQGLAAEEKARHFLIKKGFQWIESNYRCRWGEIDLIMRDKNYLVFIEVRARTSSAYGGAAASITYSKRQKLIKSAEHYLLTKKWQGNCPVRFDVVSMDGANSEMEWINNAFGMDF